MNHATQRFLTAASLAILLASCGGETPAPGSTAVAAEAQPLPRELPRSTELDFPYHYLRDVIREDRPGVFQRRVRVEYLGIDQAQVAESVRGSFAAASYTLNMEKVKDDGAMQLNFEHPGMERNVTVTIEQGGELEHPDARGIVHLTFPASPPAGTGG